MSRGPAKGVRVTDSPVRRSGHVAPGQESLESLCIHGEAIDRCAERSVALRGQTLEYPTADRRRVVRSRGTPLPGGEPIAPRTDRGAARGRRPAARHRVAPRTPPARRAPRLRHASASSLVAPSVGTVRLPAGGAPVAPFFGATDKDDGENRPAAVAVPQDAYAPARGARRVGVEPQGIDVRDRLVGLSNADPMAVPHVRRTMTPVYRSHDYKTTTLEAGGRRGLWMAEALRESPSPGLIAAPAPPQPGRVWNR